MNTSQQYQLHHTYIWLAALEAFPIIFCATLASAVPSLTGMFADMEITFVNPIVASFLVSLVFTVLLFGIIIGVQALNYRYIWYEFSTSDFKYYSGIVSKKHSNIPYQKIQSVNQKASLSQRLAGVCTVEIETAGGAGNKSVRISYIKNEEAERIRQQVFQSKRILEQAHFGNEHDRQVGAYSPRANIQKSPSNVLDVPAQYADTFRGVFGGEELDTGSVSVEYGLSNKELVLSAITGRSSFFLVLVGVLSVVCTAITMLVNIFFVSEETLIQAIPQVVSGLLWPNIAPVIVGGLLSVIFVVWVCMVVGTCISYGGFKARRRAGRIEVEYGILSHRFSGIDVARIQSINITQSFFQRIMGYCSVSYGRIAARSEDGSDNASVSLNADKIIVHPFLPLDRAHEVVSALTPEYEKIPPCEHAVDRCALRRVLIRRVVLYGVGFWLALVTVVALLVLGWYAHYDAGLLGTEAVRGPISLIARVLFVLAAILALIEALGAVLWYRASAFGYDECALGIRNGGFTTSHVVIPRQKIQFACERVNPFQRRAHVATLIAVTAAGYSCKKERLIDASQEDVTAWLRWMLPRQNVGYDDG